ncbi:helix-turn-helix domain-containing protein [Nocardia sp. NPDC050193]
MPNPTPRRRGRPVRLDRDAIVAATDAMLAANGTPAFSMRRLADRLDVSTAAIYHHFPTKGALFFAVLDARAEQLQRPELPTDPRDRLAAIVTYLIDTLHELPWAVDILSTGESYGRAAMWILDEFISAARALDATYAEAIAMYATMWRFTLGELAARKAAEERSTAVRRGRALPHWTESAEPNLAGEFPSIVPLLPEWSALVKSYDPEKAVRAVIDGLVANLGTAAHD